MENPLPVFVRSAIELPYLNVNCLTFFRKYGIVVRIRNCEKSRIKSENIQDAQNMSKGIIIPVFGGVELQILIHI